MVVQANVSPLRPIRESHCVPSNNPRATAAQSQALRQQVFEFLGPRRLITTQVKVVPPDYTSVDVAVAVMRDPASRLQSADITGGINAAVTAFLDPLTGGRDRTGWLFGHSVYRSELDQLIEGLDGVDHIRHLLLDGDENIGEVKMVSALSLVNLRQLSVSVVDS